MSSTKFNHQLMVHGEVKIGDKIMTARDKNPLGFKAQEMQQRMSETALLLYDAMKGAWSRAYFIYLLCRDVNKELNNVGLSLRRDVKNRTEANALSALTVNVPTLEEILEGIYGMTLSYENRDVLMLLVKATYMREEFPLEMCSLGLSAAEKTYIQDGKHYLDAER